MSLITAYAMNTNLPLPVISKLLAGHSRIIMTIYYNKITPSVMKRKMNEAEINLLNKSDETLQDFLLDQSLINSSCDISEVSITYNNANAVENSLKNINPLGISEVTLGLCLSGRNTSLSNNDSSISGCWNGGEFISEKNGTRIHGPVPNGSENCVRCRWFITDATKLPELTRHFNMIGYKTHIVANQASELNNQIEQLKDKKYECEINYIPFTEESTLAILQRRYEKQIVEADELTKDWISTYRLINKIISIEKNRLKKDTKDKLIAVGKVEDLIPKIKFIDVKSELSHLSILCDEAEYFPEIYDEIRKTHAIEKRTINLSKIFLKINKPIFMELDEDQQFIIGNAIMRRMAKLTGLKDKFESFEVVGNYLETGKYLSDKNLLDQTLKELSFEKILLPFHGETK